MKDQLTLEHLAPYLPYKLKAYQTVFTQVKSGKDKVTTEIRIVNSTTIYNFFQLGKHKSHEHVKPILRPLSDLTNEIVKEFFDLDSVDLELIDIEQWRKELYTDVKSEARFQYRQFQVLFKHHFDVFNLIQKNLAIDINTLEK
jgi:hypothetical protein